MEFLHSISGIAGDFSSSISDEDHQYSQHSSLRIFLLMPPCPYGNVKARFGNMALQLLQTKKKKKKL